MLQLVNTVKRRNETVLIFKSEGRQPAPYATIQEYYNGTEYCCDTIRYDSFKIWIKRLKELGLTPEDELMLTLEYIK